MFFLVTALVALVAIYFLYVGNDTLLFVSGGALFAWILAIQSVDFQFFQFSIDQGRVVLRYYPALKFGRKPYSSIEFPVGLLKDYSIEKAWFGIVKDLVLIVKTKRGIAGYPSVSMAAVSQTEQQKIIEALNSLLQR